MDYIKEKYTARVITFGTRAECDVIGTNLHTQGNCGSLTIEGQHIKAPIAGRANLMNLLTAWSVCRDFKISLSDFAAAAESIQQIAMRLQVQTIGPLTVLNDCYNANPVSMANALSCLHSMDNHDGKRKIFIAGCMAELGSQSRQLHQELGARAVWEKVHILLAAGPYAGDILTGAAQAGLPSSRMAAFKDTEQLCDNLHKWIEPDDIILVKGSRLAGMEKAIARLQELFEKQ
jgi:UDP-N-acetylmuramoyl-tripeptide--D-alanyl-D-alanine ligase